jgi:hypothetical protein
MLLKKISIIENTMSKEKFRSIAQSTSEIGMELLIDRQLANGLLKEIPIVKAIWALYNGGKSVQEYLYLRKLKLFLENIQDIDENDCQKFLKDAENNNENFSASLLLILDKIEDETKAILIANAFKLYVKERFSREIFDRLLLIINRGFCVDLLNIVAFENHEILLTNGKHIKSESLTELFSCGLVEDVGIDGGSVDDNDGGTMYSLNEYGKIFLRVVKEIKF